MIRRAGLPFALEEYQRRLAAVRALMRSRKLDALLLAGPENIHYLTGYETQGIWFPQLLVVPLEGEPAMVTRAAEETVVFDCTWLEISRPFEDHESPMGVVVRTLLELGCGGETIGLERNCYFLRAPEQEAIAHGLPDARFIDASGLVESLRAIKSGAEIEMMRKVAFATQSAMVAALDKVAPDVTDGELAAEVYRAMIAAGGHYPSMAPFVVSGPRSYVSHATWRNRPIEKGEYVFLEISATIHRYNVPMMRTAFIGKPPAAVFEAETLVREAMAAVLDAIRPGAVSGEIDAMARGIIARNSFGATQNTRVAYGIGTAVSPGWGEGHIVDIKHGDTRQLQPNMTFHVIPFLQIPGLCQVGLSESVRVTEAGCERFFSLDNHVLVRDTTSR